MPLLRKLAETSGSEPTVFKVGPFPTVPPVTSKTFTEDAVLVIKNCGSVPASNPKAPPPLLCKIMEIFGSVPTADKIGGLPVIAVVSCKKLTEDGTSTTEKLPTQVN